MPQTFTDVIELLVPELQKRGLFWEDYHVPGGTYRENLYEMKGQHEPLPDQPAAKMIWRPSPKHTHFADDQAYPAVNGATTGLTNGWHEEEEQGERLDPMSMQLS